ncbi:MAG: DUF3710 domain-containing protein [Rothia sp. (in: high G+C Gram-positive bacteria)]|uniref:DUF3710 domain-containing protein n=1 Tax=Rothia sp. (in: high G+C Gram-positive bacteria) TaxID=1885016 RepID=UPI0026E07B09|nr:DUF3710 domain-containing protein [Rothia sp. (in: high G+C Gram-positive bacteria)]MDO5750817.1 DUF3710 domain-containing protein [Rothia sp. (in: high G+C Gram-positive bacteria)]
MFGFGKKKAQREDAEAREDAEVREDAQAREESVEEETQETEESQQEQESPTEADSSDTSDEVEETESDSEEKVHYDRSSGPFDIDEIKELEDYADLGALRIPLLEDMDLRLDLDESTGAVIAATVVREGATLQVQAFAAPRTVGVWDGIRNDLADSVASQGGTVEIGPGTFGVEMFTRIPALTEDGQRGERLARFVGIDGPRWFLRGVISGNAVLPDEPNHDKAVEAIEEVFRTIVVDRGDDPRPPRELLPMRAPVELLAAQAEAQDEEPQEEELQLRPMPRRGPEITEIG